MANTYTQIYIQIVFAVQGRQNLIASQHREQLHKYITGMLKKRDQKMLAIFCLPDHLHFLMGMRPSISVSDLVRDVKAGSSNFINDSGWIRGKFHWQDGFGGFSYSRNQIDTVINYILNQEQHHSKTSFREEYIGLLREFDIEFNERYLFEWNE